MTTHLLTILKPVQQRLWFVVLLVIAAGAGALLYSSQQPPRYRVTTTLFLSPGVRSTLPGATERDTPPADDRVALLADSYAVLLSNDAFLREVVQEVDAPLTVDEARAALESHYVRGTHFVRIVATHHAPLLAQKLANSAAEVLIEREIARQQEQHEQQKAIEALPPAAQRLQAPIAALLDELARYDEQIADVEDQIAVLEDAPPTTQRNRALERLREHLRDLRYTRIDLLTRLDEVQSRAQRTADTTVVVEQAALPTTPLPRSNIPLTLLAALVALLLGSTIALLLEYRDNTIKTPEALGSLYGQPTQGVIGAVAEQDTLHQSEALIAMHGMASPAAESFRSLRASVEVAGLHTPLRSLLLTSAEAGEGTTFVAANLAVSLALNRKNVILVDANLHTPTIHHLFDLPRGPGFTNLIANPQHDICDVLQSAAVPNLRIITCGTIPPNPPELLGSPQAGHVMQQLAEQADIVIYDAPPAVALSDAVLLAQRIDGVIQVVLAGSTQANMVLRCRALLEQGGARVLGPVLNGLDISEGGYIAALPHDSAYRRVSRQRNTPRRILMLPLRWLSRRRNPHAEGEEHTGTAPQTAAHSEG